MYYKLVLYFDAFTHQSNAGNRICIFGVNLAEPIDFNGKIKFYAPRTFFYLFFLNTHHIKKQICRNARHTHHGGYYGTLIRDIYDNYCFASQKLCVNIAQGYVQTPVFSCRKLQHGKTA